jgi:hypothetical protein
MERFERYARDYDLWRVSMPESSKEEFDSMPID